MAYSQLRYFLKSVENGAEDLNYIKAIMEEYSTLGPNAPETDQKMVRHLGELAAFVVMYGQLTYQVNNGGFSQYYNNGYASSTYGKGCGYLHKDADRFEQLKEGLEELVPVTPISYKMKLLLESVEFNLDLDEYFVEETVYDIDTGECNYDLVSNENFMQLADDNNLPDGEFYEIEKEFGQFLNSYLDDICNGFV